MQKILTLAFLIVFIANFGFAQQNVILIIADDLGTDYCGFYEDHQDTANMPNIRGLLTKGVRFQNAWATPVCSPTRAGMLTGRYPFRTGVGTAISGPGYGDLDTTEISVAQLLKYHAPVHYATANIGKWHLNQQSPQKITWPAKFGYDLYAGNFLGELSDYYRWYKITNGIGDTVDNYATTENVNDAINWLDTLPQNKPFFLWLAFNAPHTPFHLPPDSLHTVTGLTGTTQHINQHPELYFEAMTEAMDHETGRLFQWLQANNTWDSTNIIFMGDNGNTRKVAQIADTSHTKGTLYEYGVHVPFIISGPAVTQPGRTSAALINTPDVFASIAEMAGYNNWQSSIPGNVTIDSKSLLPILKNQTDSVHPWVFTQQFNPNTDPRDGKAIRNRNYKLITFDDGHLEVYELLNDQLEQSDLALGLFNTIEGENFGYLCGELALLLGTDACPPVGINETEQPPALRLDPTPAGDKCF